MIGGVIGLGHVRSEWARSANMERSHAVAERNLCFPQCHKNSVPPHSAAFSHSACAQAKTLERFPKMIKERPMAKRMKAVEIDRYGGTGEMVVRETAIPEITDGRLLVRVFSAGVNPKDVMVRKGKFKLFSGRQFPKIPGYDFAGEVVRLGKNVRKFSTGDFVYGMLNGWRGGAYAEYVAANASGTALKPVTLDFDRAAAVPLAAQTALQALRNRGKIMPGDHVCVNGASGGVGTFAIQIAKSFGAVVTSVCSHRNIELCAELGSDKTMDYTVNPIEQTNERFDIFFDVFGNKSFKKTAHLLNRNGVYISTVPSPANIFLHMASFLKSGKKSKFVAVKSNTGDLEYLADLADKGEVMPVMDSIYPLDRVRDAHEYIEKKRARGKVVLKIG